MLVSVMVWGTENFVWARPEDLSTLVAPDSGRIYKDPEYKYKRDITVYSDPEFLPRKALGVWLPGAPGVICVDRVEDLQAPEKRASMFEHCVFEGDPPAPFKSWSDWCCAPILEHVVIRAVQSKKAPFEEQPVKRDITVGLTIHDTKGVYEGCRILGIYPKGFLSEGVAFVSSLESAPLNILALKFLQDARFTFEK